MPSSGKNKCLSCVLFMIMHVHTHFLLKQDNIFDDQFNFGIIFLLTRESVEFKERGESVDPVVLL